MRLDTSPDEAVLSDWLPPGKLLPPALNGGSIARPALVRALDDAIARHRLTLLSAPAGYGKTSVLGEWVQTCAGPRGLPVAWLTLDASESNRTFFLLALIAALRTLHPRCGARAQRLLANDDRLAAIDSLTQLQILIGLLIIDIEQFVPGPFVLVFDRYERVADEAVHGALDYLLHHLPGRVHVVVSSDVEPAVSFARLQVDELLATFRQEALAFTPAETGQVLAHRLPRAVSGATQAALHDTTEGWPLGVALLARELGNHVVEGALGLGMRAESAAAVPAAALDAFFEREIWRPQAAHVRRFLLETSILDELTVPLCRGVTLRADTAEVLTELWRRNLFVVPASRTGAAEETGVVDRPPVLRYHRALGAFLRRRLGQDLPEQVAALHVRAARAGDDPALRLRHWLAAGAWDDADRELAALDGEAGAGRAPAELSGWVAHLPDGVRVRYPALAAGLARLAVDRARAAAGVDLGLTRRQTEVLLLLAEGATNEEIAARLVVALPTVKGHVGQILRKLGVESRAEAVARAAEMGILVETGAPNPIIAA
jgi:LuxR family maltose regulon positive regulatory protein